MEQMEQRVRVAEPHRIGAMWSTGDADNMLIRQLNFPDTYDKRDMLMTRDTHYLFLHERKNTEACYLRHIGDTREQIEAWVRGVSDEELMSFLKDLIRPERTRSTVVWTGCRILGSVIKSESVYSFALFAKHLDTETKVYTGDDAPNVHRYGG